MQVDADFSALIDRFSPDRSAPIALAVSGGSDSLGLLHHAYSWARRNGRDLIAYTVDHRLRADARAEAEYVRDVCDARHIPHKILSWSAPKPTQNAARLARYHLLATAMKSVGSKVLLTGHTLDDVAETALIRRRRGVRDASVAGPSIAAPFPLWPIGRDLTLLRPLISTRRAKLRKTLRAEHLDWIEDPSNLNSKFERVRIRTFLVRHPRLHRLAIEAAARQQSERTVQDESLADALSRVKVHADGLIEATDMPSGTQLLTLLTRVASGGARDPRAHAVVALKASLIDPGSRQTLGGAWFQRTANGYLIGRDPGAPAIQDEMDVFDGRYAIAPTACLPSPEAASFLVRHALPPNPEWREIISDRLEHIRNCLQVGPLQQTGELA